MELATLDFQFNFIHQPNTVVTSHAHDCYELVYYFEGAGYSSTPDDHFSYSENTYSVYRSEVPHDEYHKSYTSVYCIGFKLQPFCNITISCGNYPDIDGYVQDLVDKIRRESFLHRPRYKDMFSLHLSDFLIHYERQNLKESQDIDEFHSVKQFINENLNGEIDMQYLAEISGYSYHYFRHLFKMQTGLSPKQYIVNQRIESSKILLMNSPSSILDIAQSCGFSCSSQFDIMFKKYTGSSPIQYRKMQQNESKQDQ